VSCTSVKDRAVTLCAPPAGTPLSAWQKTYALAVMTCAARAREAPRARRAAQRARSPQPASGGMDQG